MPPTAAAEVDLFNIGRVYISYSMAVRSLKLLLGGGGAVQGSVGHPAAADDLASEKGHLLAKSIYSN